MLTGPPRRRRARPVADAPIEGLLPYAEDLAKGWLLALLEQAPLDQAPGILAADLSRDGPRLCEAVLRAIADDTDLRRLEPGGALTELAGRLGELTGARGAEATAHAVDALQAVLWSALREELRRPQPDLVAEMAERLALICALLRAAALRRGEDEHPSGRPGLSAVALDAATPGPASDPRAPEHPAAAGPDRRWPDRAGPPAVPQPLWIGALQEEIERAGGAPLSLLLAELEDTERLAAAHPESGAVSPGPGTGASAGPTAAAPPTPGAGADFGEFAQAVRGVARRQDILVRETDSRAWLIARQTGRAGARALASRIAEAVRTGPAVGGTPMRASVGVAVLGEDGRTTGELIDAAEEARFAAEADGLGVGETERP